MPLVVNLRHLASRNLLLKGELAPEELDLDLRDELVRVTQPLQHDIEVQKLDESLLLRGRLALVVDCQCARCLKAFKHQFTLDAWTCLVPLEGEEAAVVDSDCVDLTPLIREDILLELPQHPLCQQDCRGLEKGPVVGKKPKSKGAGRTENVSAAWAELDKLKLKN
jgi:uncharacterized protein